MSNSTNKAEGAREVIEQLWYRARMNAFAHKEAMLDYSAKETVLFRKTIQASLGSILAIIIVYIFTTLKTEKPDSISICSFTIPTSFFIISFTFSSIVLTILSLFWGVISNHNRFGIRAEEHKYLLNSYQHIAQRAREVKWPHKPENEIIELLKDLERDFALLKARGSEPLDKHYDTAKEVFNKIKDDSETRVAQSFEIIPDK